MPRNVNTLSHPLGKKLKSIVESSLLSKDWPLLTHPTERRELYSANIHAGSPPTATDVSAIVLTKLLLPNRFQFQHRQQGK
jgi:hypothetical protein